MEIDWKIKEFSELSNHQLYDLIKLRVDVFVVEQNCPYSDLDDKDRRTNVHHLLGYNEQDQLIAYARLLPHGASYESPSIGRVITHTTARGSGVGHELLDTAIHHCHRLWPGSSIEISAQQHLEPYYQQHGFQTISDMYLEDNIPHVHMILAINDRQ